MDLLLNHSTIRDFSTKPVPDDLLRIILASGARASTTGNMQWYSVIVTKDPLRLRDLAPLHFNQPVAKTAPVILTFCADIYRFKAWCSSRNAQPGYDNFISFFTAAIDAMLMAQNVCIAAENYGLGICYLGTTTYNAAEIVDLLELPKGVVPVTAVALGWPIEWPAQVDRLPLDSFVHKETYQLPSTQQINDFYAFKEGLESSKKFVDENGKQNLAQVFTDVRYTKSNNEFFSQKYWDTIRKHWPLES